MTTDQPATGAETAATPDEFAAMLNAYTDGVSSLGKAIARRIATKDQQAATTDGYRSLCRAYADLVTQRDRLEVEVAAMSPVVEAANYLRERGYDDIRAENRLTKALIACDDWSDAATAPSDGNGT